MNEVDTISLSLQEHFPNYQRLIIKKMGITILDVSNPLSRIGWKMESLKIAMQMAGRIVPGIARTAMNRDGHLWNMRSITKSVLSLLVGIALDNGILPGLEITLAELIPDQIRNHRDKATITLNNLLQMTSGLPEMDSLDKMVPLVTSKNWLEHILSLPLVSNPGEKYIYSTGASHVAAFALQNAMGQSLDCFLQESLLNPLEISDSFWEKDPQGVPFGGANLFLKPPDLLKIGSMVMQEGLFDGQRIVSKTWIQKSTKNPLHTEIDGYGYCLGWWRIGQPIAAGFTLAACGFGGQRIYIRPKHDLIAAVISRPSFYRKTSDLDKIMLNRVIPYFENV